MKRFRKLCAAALAVGLMLPQILSGYPAEAAGGKWKHNSKGWWYSYSNGSYAKNEWVKDGGKWYYFDNEGYMVTGWKKINKKWYYFASNGAMVTGWRKIGGKWYHFSGSGAMQTGWKKIGGKCYYFAGNGSMVTGWQLINDLLYYFFEDGSMATGTVNIDGGDYLFDENGALIIMGFETDYPKVYGWNYAPRELNDEEKAIFENAKSGYEGVDYKPVQVLGTQTETGTEYLFLCHAAVVDSDSKPTYALVSVYNDLEGYAQILGYAISEVPVPAEDLEGGYFEREEMAPTEEDLEDFNKAAQLLTGVNYKPIAVVGFQVVMGLNYRVLCEATPVEPNSDSYFTFVNYYTYDDLCSINSLDPFS